MWLGVESEWEDRAGMVEWGGSGELEWNEIWKVRNIKLEWWKKGGKLGVGLENWPII